jgi:hypothetical protein
MEPWRAEDAHTMEIWRLKMELWRAQDAHAMEAWRLKMEPWWMCRPLIADSHHFNEEQDSD